MLICCPECKNGCSPKADVCPKCGQPLVAPLVKPSPIDQLAQATQQTPYREPVVVRPVQTVQTIERTGKGWKLIMLIGSAAMLYGVTSCIMTITEVTKDGAGTEGTPVAGLALVLGFALYVFGRIGAWWFHG